MFWFHLQGYPEEKYNSWTMLVLDEWSSGPSLAREKLGNLHSVLTTSKKLKNWKTTFSEIPKRSEVPGQTAVSELEKRWGEYGESQLTEAEKHRISKGR